MFKHIRPFILFTPHIFSISFIIYFFNNHSNTSHHHLPPVHPTNAHIKPNSNKQKKTLIKPDDHKKKPQPKTDKPNEPTTAQYIIIEPESFRIEFQHKEPPIQFKAYVSLSVHTHTPFVCMEIGQEAGPCAIVIRLSIYVCWTLHCHFYNVSTSGYPFRYIIIRRCQLIVTAGVVCVCVCVRLWCVWSDLDFFEVFCCCVIWIDCFFRVIRRIELGFVLIWLGMLDEKSW